MSTETDDIAQEVERTIERLNRARWGDRAGDLRAERVVDETLITILAGGHVLLVGVLSLAKTKLAETWAWCWGWCRSGCSSRPT